MIYVFCHNLLCTYLHIFLVVDLSYSSNDESGASTSTSSEKYHKSPVRARSVPHQTSYTVTGKSQRSPGTESEGHSPNKEIEGQ